MAGIDESLDFYPLRIAVLTISDSRDETTDKSGALLAERVQDAGHGGQEDDCEELKRFGEKHRRNLRMPAPSF